MCVGGGVLGGGGGIEASIMNLRIFVLRLYKISSS